MIPSLCIKKKKKSSYKGFENNLPRRNNESYFKNTMRGVRFLPGRCHTSQKGGLVGGGAPKGPREYSGFGSTVLRCSPGKSPRGLSREETTGLWLVVSSPRDSLMVPTPQIHRLRSWPPGPQNVTGSGDRVFAKVTKLKGGH